MFALPITGHQLYKVQLSPGMYVVVRKNVANDIFFHEIMLWVAFFRTRCYNTSGLAEVDFVIQNGESIIPIEVKSGMSVNAKSLKVFREKFSPRVSLRTSMQNLRCDDSLLNVPLYLLGELPRFLAQV